MCFSHAIQNSVNTELEQKRNLFPSEIIKDKKDVDTLHVTWEHLAIANKQAYGEQILVYPILEPNAKGRRMYVPKGKWYDFWTDEVVEVGREVWVDADLDSMPMFIKEGAVIPKYREQQCVSGNKFDKITLDVYYKEGKESSKLYDDAHDGYDYKKGRFSLRTFKVTGKKEELIL